MITDDIAPPLESFDPESVMQTSRQFFANRKADRLPMVDGTKRVLLDIPEQYIVDIAEVHKERVRVHLALADWFRGDDGQAGS